jgi:MFS transporter, FSR family, fosmidomycin resistance protein
VLQARLYGALDGASGLVLTVGALFPLNAVLPLGIAALAERWGLGAALWPLLAAPVALLLLVPRRGYDVSTGSDASRDHSCHEPA